MIVQCPNCATRYNLPDDKFKEGAKAKCKACKHVFTLGEKPAPRPRFSQSPEKAEPPQARGRFEEKQDGDLLAGLGSEFDPMRHSFPLEQEGKPQPPKSKREEDEFLPKDEEKGVERDDEGYYNLRQSLNIDFNAPEARRKKSRAGRLFLVLLLLLALAGVAYFGISTFYPQLLPEQLKMSWTPQPSAPVQPEAPAEAPPVIATNQIKNISLVNVKQYFVKNEKIGKVFVIEGAVVNNFEVPKEMIKIEASLYDSSGKVLNTKQQYCVNTVSLFQLQVLNQEELESHLKNEIGILSKNTFVQPGNEVPFMVLFYEAPAEVREFAVNVVEARDPPEQQQ